jgi:hypothetical protein
MGETATSSAVASPLLVGDADLGSEMTNALTKLGETVASVTDSASAEAALPELNTIKTSLETIGSNVARLSPEGTAQLSSLVKASLPAIEEGAKRLTSDTGVSSIVGNVIGEIMSLLNRFAAN